MADAKIDAALELLYSGDVDGCEAALKEIGSGKLEAPGGLDPLDEAAFNEGVGGISLAREDGAAAVAAFQKMIDLESSVDIDVLAHGTSYAKLSEAHLMAGDFEPGQTAFVKALELKKDGPAASLLNIAFTFGETLFHGGKFKDAAETFEKALKYAAEAGVDAPTLAVLQLYNADSWKNHIAPLEGSVRLQESTQGGSPQIQAFKRQLEGQFKLALELYKTAKVSAETANMPADFKLQIQRSLAELYHNAAKYVKGVMHRKKVIKMATEHGVEPLELAYMHHGLGESQKEMRQIPDAVESFKKAISYKEKAKADNVSQGKSWFSAGECYAGMDKLDAAQTAFEKARDLEADSNADDENHLTRLRKYWYMLGRTLQAAGKEEEGQEAIKTAEEMK
ncbi:MAG: hypothetical protein V3V10_05460 [Planctomycetota bacterium]